MQYFMFSFSKIVLSQYLYSLYFPHATHIFQGFLLKT